MKSPIMFLCLLLTLVFLTVASCSKSSTGTSIKFNDSNLTKTQTYSVGKWKFVYATGGFTGYDTIKFTNAFATIGKDSLIVTGDKIMNLKESITWVWTRGYNAFILTDANNEGIFIVSSLINDTLILSDVHSEAYTCRLIHAK